ncbi:hypothetical protein ACIQMY_32595 [Streptomyces sp. NPDC091368]|uniref:hypothetical protein n=1 Tax=Streptomyces sp. NPDC091368 TaxID=3365993 RepID=UPI00380F2DAE
MAKVLGHSLITTTADRYTSLLPETSLAIGEAAARFVPRARTTFENIAPALAPERDRAEGSVPDGADPAGDVRKNNSSSAPAPFRRTAPDDESEAE